MKNVNTAKLLRALLLVAVFLENAVVNTAAFSFSPMTVSIVFSGDAAAGIDGQNILALPERTFFVPWDTAVTGTKYAGSITAEIE